MKRFLIIVFCLMLALAVPACSPAPAPDASSLPTGTLPPPPTAAPSVTATAEPTVSPSEEPTPTPFGETPLHKGSGDVLFDIYVSEALVDLNQDGTPEQITFTAGADTSSLQINGETFTISRDNQAQLFAVTDVDITDGMLELAFTDEYSDDLADTEFPFTYLYWWNSAENKLINMGGLMNMKFDGQWMDGFDPLENLDGHGLVMCLTRTQNFTDIWYTGHYQPDGADRKLKEVLYKATPLFHPAPLTTKNYILLLKNIDNTYFDFAWQVIWDYASLSGGYADKPRDYSDDIVAFIPQAGEELTVCAVYGKMWFKLKAADGKQGWLKCKDMKVYGYWPTMGQNYTADNLFDGIVVAG